MEDEQDVYKTRSLYVAAYIRVKKEAEFLGLRALDERIKLFLFAPFTLAKRTEQEYYDNGAVSAFELFKEYNVLKDMLFTVRF